MNQRHVHPWVFMVLIIPFGAQSGYAGVTLAYQLKAAGVTVATVVAVSSLSILPQTWKFFWGPLVDITLTQKKWCVISIFLTGLGTAMLGFFPATNAGLTALRLIVFTSSLASTFSAMAIDNIIAHSVPDELRGHASGWYQAGNLGGYGLGGGLGLLLADKLHSPWLASLVVGGLCLPCCLVLLLLPSIGKTVHESTLLRSLGATLKDFWHLVSARAGLLVFVLSFLPIGTASAPFPVVSDEWHASAKTVAYVSGVLGGLVAAAGCVVGGWACDRMDRKSAYVWFGIAQAASAIAMALLPRTEAMFAAWVLIYTFTSGLCYAAFFAFVFEAIGAGAAATKCTAIVSLSNVPIYYMANVDGWAFDHWKSGKAMLFTEAACAFGAGILFLVLARILLPPRTAAPAPVPV